MLSSNAMPASCSAASASWSSYVARAVSSCAADQRIRQLRRGNVRPLLGHGELGQEHRLRIGRRTLQPLARCLRRDTQSLGAICAQLEGRFVRRLLGRREITIGLQAQALIRMRMGKRCAMCTQYSSRFTCGTPETIG
jgi:hypothetical protein